MFLKIYLRRLMFNIKEPLREVAEGAVTPFVAPQDSVLGRREGWAERKRCHFSTCSIFAVLRIGTQ